MANKGAASRALWWDNYRWTNDEVLPTVDEGNTRVLYFKTAHIGGVSILASCLASDCDEIIWQRSDDTILFKKNIFNIRLSFHVCL